MTVGGTRYIFVRGDVGVCILFKQGGNGLLAYKSSQGLIPSLFFFNLFSIFGHCTFNSFKAVIVGFHDSSVKAEIAATAIGKVIDHLSKHGY